MTDSQERGLDWEQEAAQRRAGDDDRRPVLPAPTGLRASSGRGQVTLDWEPVDGAAGYLVRRAAAPDGDYEPLEIGEPWVRPVPHPPLTDTTGTPGVTGWYTVAAVAAVDDRRQPQSDAVEATPLVDGEAACRVVVDVAADRGELPRPWRPMIGGERLSQLDHGVGPGGRPIGDEYAEALRLAHDQLGVSAVRAHAILHDDLGVYRERDGRPVHDFSGIDRIYDRVLGLGLRPVVEVSFMPRDLARDPDRTVFHYDAIISPPKDWDRWEALVTDLAAHLVERYGLDEVRTWGFEIWNEANLEVFWSGTRDEYMRLYDISARAVKAVDGSLPVGGPASAAVGWIDDLLGWVGRSGAALDFLSTHTYGNAPLDLRPIAARHGKAGVALWWTEWGAHATHFDRVHDTAWSAAYLVRGMVSAMGRLDALAYWTISDHFEELGRPAELLHGGFGLLAVGNLRKPRWWGLWMLEQLGPRRVAADVSGDGAGDMVDAVATTGPDGEVASVVWNGTVDVTKAGGSALLGRDVSVTFTGLPPGAYRVRHRRLDQQHSDLDAAWRAMRRDDQAWPDPDQWELLAAADHLEDHEPPTELEIAGGELTMQFALPMPSVSLIELTPTGRRSVQEPEVATG
ncbi:GH39 family glycosyl hydrolase [Desertimonas flava]|uniref:GH39 family glycosyl hydrolase n=1 Tax=Desertimonas flava TaxID=2064846 RepID=UPI000E34A4BD|nr:xylan 1,4-beta-xylosidase [Desertimonas flava]